LEDQINTGIAVGEKDPKRYGKKSSRTKYGQKSHLKK
jgi:hypothetical protein